MATEILVNDGGAPARIMNLGVGNAAIDAGTFVDIASTGKIVAAGTGYADAEEGSTGQTVALGVLLTDAAANGATSIITGKGVVCNVIAGEALSTIGTEVTINGDGNVEATADADNHRAVGITLAASVTTATKSDGSAIPHMVKVLLV